MNNNMLRKIKDEKGAASILVIIIAAAFITVSTGFIVNSYDNFRNSIQTIEKNNYYYELDTMGENFIADIDSRLSLAEEEAVNYILNRDFDKYSHKELPVELQNKIKDLVASAKDINFTYNEAMNIVYLYYSDSFLTGLKEKYETSTVSSLKTDNEVHAIISEVIFTSADRPDFHITITSNINKLDYSFTVIDNAINAEKLSDNRFSIAGWIHW